MLYKGRLEIEGKGPFAVCFRSEGGKPWTTRKIGFNESEETIMFLVDWELLSPQEAANLVLDAITKGRSVSQKIVCSKQQLQSGLGRTLHDCSDRRAS
jgi:hypothetical protein